MKLQSLQIGNIKDYKNFQSAFLKDIYLQYAKVETLKIQGDEIADTKHHGGFNKAIFANSCQNYPLWEKFLNKKLNFGAMGENLSLNGMHECNVCIGDIHKINNVILQVSEPRKPCIKISLIHNHKGFTQEIFRSGLSGWYYKVLETGELHAQANITILEKNEVNLSILELNALFFNPKNSVKQNPNILSKLEKLDTLLSKNWHDCIQKRLNNTYDISYMQKL
ncbi:MOSC domain-containing protein [Helicobacter burdigaliensis]|uniref:MOSC domain-containing protein n=1 Tax=Helicobacter burdigaliensis TaxID=2315334 RepID=UPI000EF69EC3|nr:MOSC domain-containing protein [Helicobacter burdigaliensis]